MGSKTQYQKQNRAESNGWGAASPARSGSSLWAGGQLQRGPRSSMCSLTVGGPELSLLYS